MLGKIAVSLFLLGTAGCAGNPATGNDQEPQQTFPTLTITSFSAAYHADEGSYEYWVFLVHEAGPCIDPRDYQWEMVDDGHVFEEYVEGAFDGAASGELLVEWCMHEEAAIGTGDHGNPETIRGYEKATGALVFSADIPPLET